MPDIKNDIVTAGLLVIGDEILSGRTKDKNIGHIAGRLTNVGIRLSEVRVVADDEAAIIAALNALRTAYDYVFTTGGIGPTHDDITADAVAKALGVTLIVDPRAVAMMRERYPAMDMTPARLRMARMPEDAIVIANPVSAAPGFMTANVIVMAGIPAVMQAMLENVLPLLRKGQLLHSLSLCVLEKEGTIAPILTAVQDDFADVKIGSYPFYEDDSHGANIVLRSVDSGRLEAALGALTARLDAAGVGYRSAAEMQSRAV